MNVPNFGPGTEPGMLRRWAQAVEGLGFDLLMISDHIAVTADVAEQYPAPFYEPFTTLAWLADLTGRIRLGTTVLILPYRHPLLIARMAANLNDLSGGRLVLGVGAGWAMQEFGALGVPFAQRGKLPDDYLRANRAAGRTRRTTGVGEYRSGSAATVPATFTDGVGPDACGPDAAIRRARCWPLSGPRGSSVRDEGAVAEAAAICDGSVELILAPAVAVARGEWIRSRATRCGARTRCGCVPPSSRGPGHQPPRWPGRKARAGSALARGTR